MTINSAIDNTFRQILKADRYNYWVNDEDIKRLKLVIRQEIIREFTRLDTTELKEKAPICWQKLYQSKDRLIKDLGVNKK